MRIFAALPLPEQPRELLAESARSLKLRFPGLSTVRKEGLHLTLLFFGEQPEPLVSRLVSVLERPELRVPNIIASLGEYGQFPQRGRPRVLFCGLEQGAREVTALYERLRLLVRPELGELPKGPFSPHITLARNRRGLKGEFFVAPPGDLVFVLDRLVLYRSDLKPGGAEYTALKTIILMAESASSGG